MSLYNTSSSAFIPFNSVISLLHPIKSLNSFVNYLAEIWKDFARRSHDKSKGINELSFSEYFSLPGLIGERLFNVFDKDSNGYLSPNEFINGMTILFSDSFTSLIAFTFTFYDFDNDKYITKEDIRLVLSYIPFDNTNDNTTTTDLERTIQKQQTLFEMIELALNDKERITLSEYEEIVRSKCSDVFLLLIAFIIKHKPFNEHTIGLYDVLKNDLIQEDSNDGNSGNSSNNINHSNTTTYIRVPMLATTLYYGLKADMIDSDNEPCEYDDYDDEEDEVVDSLGYNSSLAKTTFVCCSDKNVRTRSGTETEENEVDRKLQVKKQSEDILIFNTPSNSNSNSNTTNTVNNSNKPTTTTTKHKVNDNQCEGYLLKINSKGKITKTYFKLLSKDLYYYSHSDDLIHQGMHNLSGVYFKENETFTFNDTVYYSFTLIFPRKPAVYYTDNENDYIKWTSCLKQAVHFEQIEDIYEINETIGSGNFGVVKKGIHKLTGRKVAIKIINKEELIEGDMKMIKNEIEIMKIGKHPNVITLYHILENEAHIYLIMEYCAGGDLYSYIKQRNFKLPEARTAELMHKLCAAVYYLHSYGIIHRDIKPENILMTDTTDNADIKLLDFGLSKILTPKEKCCDTYGTISYCAPEILLNMHYNKSADLWSIGIIAYLLLSGCLPFDHESSEKEIMRQTIYDAVPFYHSIWKHISPEAKGFVSSLLQKEPDKRMDLCACLESDWFCKYNESVIKIRKESHQISNVCKFGIYSNINEQLIKRHHKRFSCNI
jgi:serine/threonine protein kinase/Ca2+-binding EF-hand superfamily protein